MGWKIALHMCGWGGKPLPDLLVAARGLGYDRLVSEVGLHFWTSKLHVLLVN